MRFYILALVAAVSFRAFSSPIELSAGLRASLTDSGRNAFKVLTDFRGGDCLSALLPTEVSLEVLTGHFSYGGQPYNFGTSDLGLYFNHRYNSNEPNKHDVLIVVAPASLHSQLIGEVTTFVSSRYPGIKVEAQALSGTWSSAISIDDPRRQQTNLNLPGVKFNFVGVPALLDLAMADLTSNSTSQNAVTPQVASSEASSSAVGVLIDFRGGKDRSELLPSYVTLNIVTSGFTYAIANPKYTFGTSPSLGRLYFYRRYNANGSDKHDSLIIVAPAQEQAGVTAEALDFFARRYPSLRVKTTAVNGTKYSSISIDNQIGGRNSLSLPGIKFEIVGPPALLDQAIADFLQTVPIAMN